MVDDPEHKGDIVRRVREVLQVIWKDHAETIEKEICEIMGCGNCGITSESPATGGFGWIMLSTILRAAVRLRSYLVSAL